MTAVIDRAFKTRSLSAALLAPAVLAILYFGGAAFMLLLAAAAGIGIYEWARMVKNSPLFLIGGTFYITFSLIVMGWIRLVPADGLYHTLTLLLIVWASDISAYVAGKSIGGPKLAPVISPKKTWAGFAGSSIGASIVAAGMACPWVLEKFDVTPVWGMGSGGYFVMGFVLAMFGQMGDLLKSIFKRRAGVKDSGTIIPGHGGILDRIDALLMVALLFGLLIRAGGPL